MRVNHGSKRSGSCSEPDRRQAVTTASWVASWASMGSPRMTAARRYARSSSDQRAEQRLRARRRRWQFARTEPSQRRDHAVHDLPDDVAPPIVHVRQFRARSRRPPRFPRLPREVESPGVRLALVSAGQRIRRSIQPLASAYPVIVVYALSALWQPASGTNDQLGALVEHETDGAPAGSSSVGRASSLPSCSARALWLLSWPAEHDRSSYALSLIPPRPTVTRSRSLAVRSYRSTWTSPLATWTG